MLINLEINPNFNFLWRDLVVDVLKSSLFEYNVYAVTNRSCEKACERESRASTATFCPCMTRLATIGAIWLSNFDCFLRLCYTMIQSMHYVYLQFHKLNKLTNKNRKMLFNAIKFENKCNKIT